MHDAESRNPERLATEPPSPERVVPRKETGKRLASAVQSFFAGNEAGDFLANVELADEVLAAEEASEGRAYAGKPDPRLYAMKEERELAIALVMAREEADKAMATEDFGQALHAIAAIGPLLAAFLRNVRVDRGAAADVRENRLKLLNEIRKATRVVGHAA